MDNIKPVQADNGQMFVLQYIRNLEDQLMVDNYEIGKELIKQSNKVSSIIKWLYHAKFVYELQTQAYEGYQKAVQEIPDQKYGTEWMNTERTVK